MKCPYCNDYMKLGVIHGDRYALKWVSKEKDNALLYPFIKGVNLTDNNFNDVEAYLCDSCKKVIIDLPK